MATFFLATEGIVLLKVGLALPFRLHRKCDTMTRHPHQL